MKIKIKRFDKSLPLPEYKTEGAAGIDLYTREDTVINAHSFGNIPLNVAMEIPKGTFVMLLARSSTHKMGLMPANGVGIGDEDFKGDNDEYTFLVYNPTDEDVLVEKGDRVAQIILMSLQRVDIEEVDHLDNVDRGGLGSTGKK
ncbi:MAG: dUTP diphosphatase [Candidatus Dojkabacteria bacterium]|nr:dUTP diphosphatase [Candidatus Dojkabacteria bacterium]